MPLIYGVTGDFMNPGRGSSITFGGPIRSGTIPDSVGTTLGSLRNVGHVVMCQSNEITQSGSVSSFDTSIVVPSTSRILGISCLVSTAWSGGDTTIDVGDGTDDDLFVDGMDCSASGLVQVTTATTGTVANWKNIGIGDVRISVKSVNIGAGEGLLVVQYVQSIDIT